MRFLSLIALLSIAPVVLACEAATVTGPGWTGADSGTDPRPDAGPSATPEQMFASTVLPILETRCVGCHGSAGGTGTYFIDPSDPHQSLLTTTLTSGRALVTPGDVEDSYLVQIGAHRGPDFSRAERTIIETWIMAEAEAEDAPPVTPPPPGGGASIGPYVSTTIDVVYGTTNRIALDEAGLPGAELTFDAALSGAGLLMTNVELRAGATRVSISHPLFLVNGTEPTSDAFSTLALTLDPGAVGSIAATHILSGFPDTNGTLTVSFEVASEL